MQDDFSTYWDVFKVLYGDEESELAKQVSRYQKLVQQYEDTFPGGDYHFFSTPGRTEIGGNHTDHNHGRVLAASVNLDSISVAESNSSERIELVSQGYAEPFVVDLNHLEAVEEERGITTSLIRGIAARFKQLGYNTGGFNAVMSSQVLPGSGLSSSASVEVLIGTIFNYLFNQGKIDPETIAKTGQYAENYFFGKPCGLMDQMACAIGGIISIDFESPENPQVHKVVFDFAAQNYSLLVVDTGGTHADLTDAYAAVPAEMKAVARALGKTVCREITIEQLMGQVPELRKITGDRAILRAFHFLQENERVVRQVQALEMADFSTFLSLVRESGNSSFKWLQNIYSTLNVKEQSIALALALTEDYLRETGEGVCRVHGGGFAGTIQVFMPAGAVSDYCRRMENVFGTGSVLRLSIRHYGAMCLDEMN